MQAESEGNKYHLRPVLSSSESWAPGPAPTPDLPQVTSLGGPRSSIPLPLLSLPLPCCRLLIHSPPFLLSPATPLLMFTILTASSETLLLKVPSGRLLERQDLSPRLDQQNQSLHFNKTPQVSNDRMSSGSSDATTFLAQHLPSPRLAADQTSEPAFPPGSAGCVPTFPRTRRGVQVHFLIFGGWMELLLLFKKKPLI